MNKKLMMCLVVVAGMLGLGAHVEAGIAVDPTVIEASIPEGASQEGTYTVINTGQDEIKVKIELVDWMKEYFGKTGTTEVNAWLSLAEKEFIMAPAEVKKVPYTITIPVGMDKEQAAQVFFGFQSTTSDDMFKTRLGVIVYTVAKGTERFDATIDKIALERVTGNAQDVVAIVTLTNKGTVHIRPSGVVKVLQDDQVVATIAIGASKGIYADSTDTVQGISRNCSLPAGQYTLRAEMECGMYGIPKTVTKQEQGSLS